MTKQKSNAAREREDARRALANGDLHDRDLYTAKQVAFRCGTDAKTMRKFFRTSHSTVDPVGQGGRYEFDAADLPQIKKEFKIWSRRASLRERPKPVTEVHTEAEIADAKRQAESMGDDEFTGEQIADAVEDQMLQENAEPTDEELAEIEEGSDEDLR